MDELIIKGYWWLPSKPEEKIAGVLTFNGKDPSTLELFGCFESFNSQNYRKFDPDACEVILGFTQRGIKYSLLNNIRSSFSTSSYEICTFTTNIILEGIHINDMRQQCFFGEILSFKNLRTWYKEDMIEVQESEDFQTFKCKINNLSNGRKVDLLDGAELFIVPSYRNAFSGWNNEIHLFQSTQLVLDTPKPCSVWDFLEKAKILQQFVSLLFLAPQYFERMSLKTRDDDYYDVRVYVRNDDSIKPLPWAFLKYDIIKDKLDDILRKWFEYSEDLYPIQNHLFRTLDSNKSVGNEDFLVVAQAIDGLTKGMISISGKLEGRIDGLYDRLSGIQRLQNNKIDSKVFRATRNFYTHMSKGKDYCMVAIGQDLIALQQKSKLLLTCALLHIYGLS
ncbi:MAG: hypothetical protein MJY69_00745 [Bacteroidales bacterium]|nr:hypothetical protein [Bacteroidales bacterium]